MVTGAFAGPNEKSAPLTGGKSDSELGADVGSAVIAEQLMEEVGVSIMIGFSTTPVGVGEIAVPDEQALNRKVPAMKKNEI